MTWNNEYSLYEYQEAASQAIQERDLLLAFEMGCGKTPTTIHAVESVRPEWGLDSHGIVVVPSSLKYQWRREVEKFTSGVPVILIEGTPQQRRAQYDLAKTLADTKMAGYIITSYELFVRDYKKEIKPRGIGRDFLILDEATAIKNYDSKRSKTIKQFRQDFSMRVALTGTPVENGRAEELFSIMEFVEPRLLGRFWDFDKRYIRRNPMGWIDGYRNLDELHAKVSAHVARARHTDPLVAKHLPRVNYESPIYVSLDPKSQRIVDWMVGELMEDLDNLAASLSERPAQALFDDLDGPPRRDHPDGRMMAKIQTVRMFLDHPGAVIQAAKDGSSEYAVRSYRHRFREFDKVYDDSPKLDALEEHLAEFLDADPANKAVVFCSFKFPAQKIQQRLGDAAVLFHGGLSAKQRDEVKQQFVSDPDVRVFVSTDAGGYGLDLPQANMLINYDLPWSSGMLKQRNARIRRASSDWPYVTIRDLLVGETLEERMREMLDHKGAIASALVDGEEINDLGDVTSSLGSLRDFLYDLIERR